MSRNLILIALLFITGFTLQAQNAPKREFRGAWLHIVGNQQIKDMSKDELQAFFVNTLNDLKKQNCNAVFFQVRPQADAFYPSELEPWTRFLTGEQGVAPNPLWDPLEFMIDECHKRGMELHAWLNPYRVTSNGEEQLSPTHLYFQKPEIFKRYGEQLYFDPGEPQSREHTIKVITDIVSRYDLDGIHFDDYFYPYPVKFEEFHDDDSFVKYGESAGFEYWQKNDWRRWNVEVLMQEINDTIKTIKPYIKFGISPFGIHRNKKETPDGSGSETNGLSNYEQLFADVPAWAEKGYIDYIVPQLYWEIGHPAADYETLINWWNNSNFKGQLYIGQSISTFTKPDLKNPKRNQMARKMELVRTLENVDGNVWWPGWSLSNGAPRHIDDGSQNSSNSKFNIADSLSKVYQKHPALIPAFSDIDSTAPDAVNGLEFSGNKLIWDVEDTDDVMQEPHFFVVYKFRAQEKVDLSRGDCIAAIVRSLSYIPDVKKDGKHKFVVTVVDRCWNESEASKEVIY